MPIYDARLNAWGHDATDIPAPCQPFPDRHVGVFDANGAQINYVRRCNTETGEVERYAHDGSQFVIGPDRRVVVLTEIYPAPLTIKAKERS